MAQESLTRAASHRTSGEEQRHSGNQLGPLLCWAVVFADVGTSVYYVPGILYGNVGNLAGFFVFLTMSVFVLLTLKYAEVTYRFPHGGGVVAVGAQAINHWVGALGGMFILVDYFLTAAISCLSGMLYLSIVIPAIGPFALEIAVCALILLGLLNWIGVSESAKASLVGAIIAFVSDIAILFTVLTHISEAIEEAFQNVGAGPEDIDLIVATDAEQILGIGDWGVGGIDISIGKLAVYTAAAGIDPARVIPVMLDVGTNRGSLLNDPMYVGNRHARIRGERYDAFIDAYVKTTTKLFPHALLHWEDFGPSNGRRILEKYRNQICTFNDDMQGTGGITLAAVSAALRVSGQLLRDQRVVVFGAGTAGIGIADQIRDAMIGDGLSKAEAIRCFWCVDIQGLLTDNMGNTLRDFQIPYARRADEVNDWNHDMPDGGIILAEVVHRVHPTILIGTSTAPGAFTEEIVKELAAHTERPIIFPLSNPTSLAEASPTDLITWTDGRALIATGSPFNPVTYNGVTYVIGQANNALLYPGLGLGAIVTRARHISDSMFAAAAKAVADLVDTHLPGASLLPYVENLRNVSTAVAVEVAKAAATEGLASVELMDVVQQVQAAMWQPVYPQIQKGGHDLLLHQPLLTHL